MQLSIVIPLYNEQNSLKELNETIEKVELSGGLLYYSVTPEGLSTWRVFVVNSDVSSS